MTDSNTLTYLEDETAAGPNGHQTRRGKAFYPDGLIRTVHAGIADTMFTVPAHGRMNGRYVAGFLAISPGGHLILHVHRKGELKIASVAFAKLCHKRAKEWYDLTGDIFSASPFLVKTVVAEYLANQHGFTLYQERVNT